MDIQSTEEEVVPKKQHYPKNVSINFNKLERHALMKLAKHYKINPKVGTTQPELASLVAKSFEAQVVNEGEIVMKFSHNVMRSTSDSSSRSKVGRYSRHHLDSEPAKVGEQVATRVDRTIGNGSWILGNITLYDAQNEWYVVQDEDDTSRSMRLHMRDVKRLEDSASHLKKGDGVLAVFPDTTSFYRAVVAKNPKTPAHVNSSGDVIVRFEDDEDETGVAPPRRVPARFVLRRNDVEDEDEFDNM